MIVGITLDDWKLPVFRKGLTDAGYGYRDAGEMLPGTTMLQVETDDLAALAKLIGQCQRECDAQGKPS